MVKMGFSSMEDMNEQDWLCTRCHTVMVYMPKPDYRLLNRMDTIGYCYTCKAAYFAEHREELRQAYQDWLNKTYPTPGYVYGLIDPRDRGLYYIGRTHDLAARIRDHRRTSAKEKTPRAAWILNLHEQGLTFEHCILATTVPGYYVVELEARWICHALQQ